MDINLQELKIEKEKKAADKEAARLLEIENIKNGNVKIKAHYQDGEYLNGFTVHGEAGELLEKLGILHYTSGWGYYLQDKVIEALGGHLT